jgi:hypothetical protein
MIKIENLDFWERPEYIKGISNLDKELFQQDGFYFLTHTAHRSGLEHDEFYFEDEEYGQALDNLESKVDEAFFELLDICYKIGEFDSRMIVLPVI